MKPWRHEIKKQIPSSPLVFGAAGAVSVGLSPMQNDSTGLCHQSWRRPVHLEQVVASGKHRCSREGEVPGRRVAQTGFKLAGGSRQPARLDRATPSWFGCGDAARTFAGAAVLSLSSATRVLVATTPVDLRGSFNRLYSLVVEQLKVDPLSGHLFRARSSGSSLPPLQAGFGFGAYPPGSAWHSVLRCVLPSKRVQRGRTYLF